MKLTIKAIFLITIITTVTLSQDIYSIWLIQEQYSNDVLIIDKPYMKYEFTYDGIWNVEAKQGYNIGDFNYLQQGGTYKIEGDIFTIWHNDKFDRVKMVFKRVIRNDT